ncbi:protein of unknown function (plasmid) [Cupriavidus taiwanensis]|uniref:Uncharacterized protein n=1 Tax=Cupriavidus taiwanensis TaxID=164546 RepID=A0A7Z7JGS6_9BURK|nr:protein of unknown function [Cupriavidus taiwanensis]SOZ12936.1 protein of unknown function [Cupriavidus taiwanensis]SOZ41435.1 protein of unknown function [Cupriavidus taiwanensis]SPC23809.1 protein of unknown function [Cupriavidus taiwanensis]SPD54990.1 protein of unknown function [Cupriavidus taiwanensis]
MEAACALASRSGRFASVQECFQRHTRLCFSIFIGMIVGLMREQVPECGYRPDCRHASDRWRRTRQWERRI